MTRPVTVVGVGADGAEGLSRRASAAIDGAWVLAGGERLLALFPGGASERIPIGGDLDAALGRVAAAAERGSVCVLASGDPLFFGVGARVVAALGAERVEVLPHPSSVQWAFARIGLSWEDAAFVSLHARARDGLAARLRRRAKVACLTGGANGPAEIARHLLRNGERDLAAWVCERLGGRGERIRRFDDLAALAACDDVDPLNVLVLTRPRGWRPPPAIAFLPERSFETRRGLVTKREVRVLALATLALPGDALVWDVGAGSGSVSIEASRLAPEGRVFAVERDREMARHCARNVLAHGADNVTLVEGAAPGVLGGLPDPDAVFVGGGGGELEAIVGLALERLRPGGRIAVAAVTLETLEAARRAFAARALVPEIVLASFSRAVPIAGHVRLEPLTPVHLLWAAKGAAR